MIIWGGYANPVCNTGGRYSPASDAWAATGTADAPGPRLWHTAVWTGTGMFIWGGSTATLDYFRTGGVYSPDRDAWSTTSMNSAPSERAKHTAIWTGTEMMVWGGYNNSGALNGGSRYTP